MDSRKWNNKFRRLSSSKLILFYYYLFTSWNPKGKCGQAVSCYVVIMIIVGFGECWLKLMLRLLVGRNLGIVISKLVVGSFLMIIHKHLVFPHTINNGQCSYLRSIVGILYKNAPIIKNYTPHPHFSSSYQQTLQIQ